MIGILCGYDWYWVPLPFPGLGTGWTKIFVFAPKRNRILNHFFKEKKLNFVFAKSDALFLSDLPFSFSLIVLWLCFSFCLSLWSINSFFFLSLYFFWSVLSSFFCFFLSVCLSFFLSVFLLFIISLRLSLSVWSSFLCLSLSLGPIFSIFFCSLLFSLSLSVTKFDFSKEKLWQISQEWKTHFQVWELAVAVGEFSVTRFDENSPLWQNFKSIWQICKGLLSFGKIYNLLRHICNMLVGKFSPLLMAKYWTNNLAIWSHCYSSSLNDIFVACIEGKF